VESTMFAPIVKLQVLRSASFIFMLRSATTAIVITLLCGGLAACATIAKGSAQTIAIHTDPPGAACTLTRAGQLIGDVNPTPATVSVFKADKPIMLRCRKQGYAERSTQIGTGFEGATVGNIFFGGLIGVFVDMGSGATHEYPSNVAVTLIPTEFPSVTERDAFFDRLRASFLTEWQNGVQQIKSTCAESECDRQLKAAEKLREARLAEIEQARREARVRP
jgi:hypothetical protein